MGRSWNDAWRYSKCSIHISCSLIGSRPEHREPSLPQELHVPNLTSGEVKEKLYMITISFPCSWAGRPCSMTGGSGGQHSCRLSSLPGSLPRDPRRSYFTSWSHSCLVCQAIKAKPWHPGRKEESIHLWVFLEGTRNNRYTCSPGEAEITA